MKIDISQIGEEMVSSLKKFPVEVLTGLIFFILSLNSNFRRGDTTNVLLLFPAFMVLIYTLNRLCSGKWRIIYYFSIFAFVPFLWIDLSRFIFSTAYAFTLLLSFFVLLASKCQWNNTSFAKNCVQTFVNLIVAFFITHTLFLALWAIYASVTYIFNLYFSDMPEHLYTFCVFVVLPLLFCHLEEKESEGTLSRFMEIILNYILSPAVIIYTGILYLYFIVIAFKWELPKGGIGYMVLAFCICAMAGRMSQLVVSKPIYGWFYQRFSWMAIPPLIIFWIGTMERISTYGFTEPRVYLLASGVLMTLYIVFLFFKRLANYQLMAIVSSGVIILLTYIPGMNANSIGIYAQESRLNEYMDRLDVRDSVTHKLKPYMSWNKTKTDSLFIKDYEMLRGAYTYLSKELGYEYTENVYGVLYDEPSYAYLEMPDKSIPIEGYGKYYPLRPYDARIYQTDFKDGVISITHIATQKEVIRYDITTYMNAHPTSMRASMNGSVSTELFMAYNDSCMLLLNDVTYDYASNRKSPYECSNATAKALFIK